MQYVPTSMIWTIPFTAIRNKIYFPPHDWTIVLFDLSHIFLWRKLPAIIVHYDMGVSKNSGTPKSSILIGFSIINHPFWGTPIFGNTHIEIWNIQLSSPPKPPVFVHQSHSKSCYFDGNWTAPTFCLSKSEPTKKPYGNYKVGPGSSYKWGEITPFPWPKINDTNGFPWFYFNSYLIGVIQLHL